MREFMCASCGVRLQAWEPPHAPGMTCLDGKRPGDEYWAPVGVYPGAPKSTYFCPGCGAEMPPVEPAREIPS